MAQQVIDVGTSASDGTGDPLRDAFTKINDNFTELYSGNVQVTGANVLVYSVAGRTGNVVLTVNDVAQAASKSYVNTAIASNLANVTGSVTDSLNANITAANAIISNHESRITTLESNAAVQATAITNLNNTKATVAYVDTSIDLALSSNAILANVASVSANVAAANSAILLRANLSGANFTGNITANSISATNLIRTDTYFVGGAESLQQEGEQWANPAALFFGNTALPGSTTPYYQINLQNLDPLGTGDFVVTADDGNDANNYISLGMAGSQINDPYFPAIRPHDGFLFADGGNILLQSLNHNVDIMAGNLRFPQITLTTANVLHLRSNVVIEFPDGTVQSTAFGGNASVSSINANIAAANVAIANLQSNAAAQALELNSLSSNAGSQATTINNLSANATTQTSQINLINSNITAANTNITNLTASTLSTNANLAAANVNITALTANAALQELELNNLQSNAQAQQASIISLQSNAATQSVQIDLLNSNLAAANTNISSLTSNAAIQAVQVNLLNANLTAANLNIATLLSNAALQALDINNLYTNINVYLANVASSDANITAANARIIVLDANLGSITTNVSALQSNAVTQASLIDLLNANVTAANAAIQTKADLSGAVFTGNVQAEYLLANANVKIGSSLEVGNVSLIDYPGLGAVFVGNVDSYYQVVVQNTSSGPSASGDFVITADDGSDSDNYINIGINSSGFTGNFIVPDGDTGLPEFAHDGYITVIGGNTAIRADGNVFMVANTSVVALGKDGDFILFAANLQFSDGSTQSTAIQDVPDLYANIGTLSLFQSNILGNATYTPNNAANYNGTITNIQQALDELAARLKALGG